MMAVPPDQDDHAPPMRIQCFMDRRENSELFDELASFKKGARRTARLKFLANEGLRHLRHPHTPLESALTATPVEARAPSSRPLPHPDRDLADQNWETDEPLDEAARSAIERLAVVPAPTPAWHSPSVGIAAEIFGAPVDDVQLGRRSRQDFK